MVTVRRARVEDARGLCAAEREVARTPGLLVSQADELSPSAFASLIAELANGRGCYVVAEQEGKIVGHGVLDPMGLRAVAHVFRLTIVVHPGHSGRGVGSAIMAALLEWACDTDGVEKIELNVRATNEVARRLYAKFGFFEEGRFRNRIRLADGKFIDDISMAWFAKQPAA